jgi:hypothetical protein
LRAAAPHSKTGVTSKCAEAARLLRLGHGVNASGVSIL